MHVCSLLTGADNEVSDDAGALMVSYDKADFHLLYKLLMSLSVLGVVQSNPELSRKIESSSIISGTFLAFLSSFALISRFLSAVARKATSHTRTNFEKSSCR